jgi:hypothetical protein
MFSVFVGFELCSSVNENSVLQGYDTVSLANQILTFQNKSILTSKGQNGHFNPLRHGLYIVSKYHSPITHSQTVTSQKNGIHNVSCFMLCDILINPFPSLTLQSALDLNVPCRPKALLF